MKIENVPIFAKGTWNGRTYTSEDLDEIVRSFRELNLSGKLPAKLGHDTDDDAPAQGWITELHRDGDQLLATLDSVPKEMIDAIKAGRYRHVSVEMLGNVKHGDKTYSWVLDGLAILGAARPAVSVLEGLHKILSKALPGLSFKERLSFSQKLSLSGVSETDLAELTRRVEGMQQSFTVLTDENKRLKEQLINEKFNSAIRAGQLLPAERERFFKRFGATATLEDVETWISTASPPSRTSAAGVKSSGRSASPKDGSTVSPDVELAELAWKLVDEEMERLTKFAQFKSKAEYDRVRSELYAPMATRVCREDPELGKRWALMNGST